MSEVPQVLLGHPLKALRLPTFPREYDGLARRCAAEGVDHTGHPLRLAELELLERERRPVERRIRRARLPATKSLEGLDFAALPPLNKLLLLVLVLVLVLARCAGTSSGGRTRSRSAPPAPAGPAWRSASAWPPARGASRWA